jgi:hypothetical protein
MRFPCARAASSPYRRGEGALAGKSGIKVHDTDGVRVQTADGWWLLRPPTPRTSWSPAARPRQAGLERLKAQLSSRSRPAASRHPLSIVPFAISVASPPPTFPSWGEQGGGPSPQPYRIGSRRRAAASRWKM